MKALLVKYLPVTNHQGARLKLIVDGFKPITQSRKYDLDARDQALQMMKNFCANTDISANEQYEFKKQAWTLRGFGTLPNGDYVGTLESVEETV